LVARAFDTLSKPKLRDRYDADFDLISRVTGQPCEWIVPAGTVD
jgi:hypothetical protein